MIAINYGVQMYYELNYKKESRATIKAIIKNAHSKEVKFTKSEPRIGPRIAPRPKPPVWIADTLDSSISFSIWFNSSRHGAEPGAV